MVRAWVKGGFTELLGLVLDVIRVAREIGHDTVTSVPIGQFATVLIPGTFQVVPLFSFHFIPFVIKDAHLIPTIKGGQAIERPRLWVHALPGVYMDGTSGGLSAGKEDGADGG